MMQEMFASSARPFYHSADMLEPKAIPAEIYIPFVVRHFENDTIFREILSNIPEKQKELLYAIAKEVEAEHITSAEFIKRHSLTSASSVQSAAKKLLEKDLITEINKVFSLTDRLFAMWIRKLY